MEGPRGDGARETLLGFLVVLFGGGALIQLAHRFLGLGTADGNAAFAALPLVGILIAHRWLERDTTPVDD